MRFWNPVAIVDRERIVITTSISYIGLKEGVLVCEQNYRSNDQCIVTADNKSIVGYRFDRAFALSFCWYTLLCTQLNISNRIV